MHFAPLVVAVERAPSAVVLTSFTAAAGDTQALIQWQTASEVNTLGFYLQRAEAAAGPYHRVPDDANPHFFDSLGSGFAGHPYDYIDTGLTNGITYFYRLQAMTHGGFADHLRFGAGSPIPGDRYPDLDQHVDLHRHRDVDGYPNHHLDAHPDRDPDGHAHAHQDVYSVRVPLSNPLHLPVPDPQANLPLTHAVGVPDSYSKRCHQDRAGCPPENPLPDRELGAALPGAWRNWRAYGTRSRWAERLSGAWDRRGRHAGAGEHQRARTGDDVRLHGNRHPG